MDDNRKEIAKAKFIVGKPIQAIADDIGVSRRTIERWAAENDDEWRKLKDLNGQTNVIQLQPKAIKAYNKPEFKLDEGFELDDITVIQDAIADIHTSLSGDYFGKGSLATGLVKLIELKRKLKPESVADLVERAIELGVGPEELLIELKSAWQRRA